MNKIRVIYDYDQTSTRLKTYLRCVSVPTNTQLQHCSFAYILKIIDPFWKIRRRKNIEESMVSLAPWFWAMAFWRKRFQLKGDTCYPAGWRWGLASAAAGSVPNVAKTEPQTECIFFKSQKYISNLFFYIFVICFFHVFHSFSMRCPMPLRCLCILCDPGQLTEFSACLFQGFMSIHVSISDVFKGIPASLPGPWEMFSHIGWELCCGF